MILNFHNEFHRYEWPDLVTVDNIDDEHDLKNEEPGANKAHAKIYVGFYSHAAFVYKCDTCSKKFRRECTPPPHPQFRVPFLTPI